MEKVLRKTSLIAFVMAMSLNLLAQNVKSTQWDIKLSRTNLKEHDTVTLTFIGKIPDHQAVYATDFNCDLGPFPSKLVFNTDANDFAKFDSTVSVGAKSEFDEIFECEIKKFKKVAIIKQVLVFKSKDPIIKGRIEYQTCTDEMCIQFYFNFELKGTQIVKLENEEQ